MAGLNDFAGTAPKMNVSGMQTESSGPISNRELMAEARGALSGKWLFVIFSVILYYILMSSAGFLFGVVGTVVGQLWVSAAAEGVSAGMIGISAGMGLIGLVVGAFFTYGWFNYFRVLGEEGESRLFAFFEGGRKIFATVIAHVLLFGLYMAYQLVALLIFMFVLNGNQIGMLAGMGIIQFLPIYLVLRYSMVFFILTDDEYGAFGAMGRSSEIMVGFKWKLFGLFFRFWLLSLLALIPGLVVAFGVPFAVSFEYVSPEITPLLAVLSGLWLLLFSIWLLPYSWTAYAKFYEDIK